MCYRSLVEVTKLLALKRKEGVMSQESGQPLELGKGKETETDTSERNTADALI